MSSYSEFVVLLDRSGSMQDRKTDHEGGLNSFVEDQKKIDGEARFTLVQFDTQNPFELVYDSVLMQDVEKCSLIPRGGTPLLDSLGKTIAHVTERLNKSGRKPDQVVFMIITDGRENDSKEFTKDQIKSLLQEKEKENKWEFLYLGAGVSDFADARGAGFNFAKSAMAVNNSVGVAATYNMLSNKMGNARQLINRGMTKEEVEVQTSAYCFTDEDRLSLTGEE